MTTILGLDIGVASVGFALISRRADGRQVRILRMGVRVFPEGRTEDKQEPRNLERRTARLHRRGRLTGARPLTERPRPPFPRPLPRAGEPATPGSGKSTGA